MKRKGRTLALTVDDLLESKRLELAVELFKTDKKALRAILIELGYECLNVARVATTKKAVSYKSLTSDEMVELLRKLSPDDFTTFSIYWGLSEAEQKMYLSKINNDTEGYEKALKDVIKHFTCK